MTSTSMFPFDPSQEPTPEQEAQERAARNGTRRGIHSFKVTISK
jgi:hypothetical protein